MDQPFFLAAHLNAPVILQPTSFLTLDSLLGYALFAQNADARIADLPLARRHGVWAGSAAFVDSLSSPVPAPFKRSIEMRQLQREEFSFPAGRKRPYIDQARGPYRTTMDNYVAYDSPRLIWHGRGDPDACLALLRDMVPAVGKKSRQGFGQVDRWDAHPVDEEDDFSMAAQHLGLYHPTRPIPLAAWSAMGHSTSGVLVGSCAIDLPHWSSPPQTCAVPSSRLRFWIR